MASILPDFEYDIFISYRHNDNLDGWVTDFVQNLEKELKSTIKDTVTVYFDKSPHDGLLETHNVDKSLEGKLKCLIFIPIISQTYCDPKSFAWNYEFCAFNKLAKEDQFRRDIEVGNGNVASRILPVKIHDLDSEDKAVIEKEIGEILRPIEFIYKEAGVNRPLKPEDKKEDNLNKTAYRNQVNKVANAIKEIVLSLRNPTSQSRRTMNEHPITRSSSNRKPLVITSIVLFLLVVGYFISKRFQKFSQPDKSIAVLPFQNLSGDPGEQYFSDGFSEEIVNSLTRIEDLKVAGRTSSFRFIGKDLDLNEIGKQLNVETVLEGSVRRQGKRIRIDAKLISVKDGYNLWSEQFDRNVGDVFAIQEEIALAITRKLKATFLQKKKTEIGEEPTHNTEAYDAVLKGRYFWNRRELKESEKYFQKAISLDSNFALAYAGLAETYVVFPFFGAGTPDEYMPKAELAAERAIRLDSLLSVPYLTIAFKNENYDWNPVKAEKYFKKALRLDPKYAPAHYWYGHFLVNFKKDFDQAIAEMNRSVELEPLGNIHYYNLGFALLCGGKYNEGVKALTTSIELKENGNSHLYLGHCYRGLGKFDEAKKEYLHAAELSNDAGIATTIYFYKLEKNEAKAQEAFDLLINQSTKRYVGKASLASAASYLGKKELARQYLREAIKMHDVWLPSLASDPTHFPNDLFSDQANVELLKEFFPLK